MKKIIELNSKNYKKLIKNVLDRLSEDVNYDREFFGVDLSNNEILEATTTFKNGLLENNDIHIFEKLFDGGSNVSDRLTDMISNLGINQYYNIESPSYGNIEISIELVDDIGSYIYEVSVSNGEIFKQDTFGGIDKVTYKSGRASHSDDDFDLLEVDFWEIGRFIGKSLEDIVNGKNISDKNNMGEGVSEYNEGISEGVSDGEENGANKGAENSVFMFGVNMTRNEVDYIFKELKNGFYKSNIDVILKRLLGPNVDVEFRINELIKTVSSKGSYVIDSRRYGNITVSIELTDKDENGLEYVYLVYVEDGKNNIIGNKSFSGVSGPQFGLVSKFIVDCLIKVVSVGENKTHKKIIVSEALLNNAILPNMVKESFYEDENSDDYFTADDCYDGFVGNKGEEVLRYLYGTNSYQDYDIDYEELVNNYETALDNTKYGDIKIKLEIAIGFIVVTVFSNSGAGGKCQSREMSGYGLGKCVSKALENMLNQLTENKQMNESESDYTQYENLDIKDILNKINEISRDSVIQTDTADEFGINSASEIIYYISEYGKKYIPKLISLFENYDMIALDDGGTIDIENSNEQELALLLMTLMKKF